MIPLLNEAGRIAAQVASSMLVQTAILVTVLLLAERLFRQRMPAALRCALWFLIIAKLLLPPSLKSPASAGYWLGRWIAAPIILPATLSLASETRADAPRLAFAPADPSTIPFDRTPAPRIQAAPPRLSASGGLLCLWLLGSLALALWGFRRNRQVQRLLANAQAAPLDLQEILRDAAKRLGLRRLPELRLTQSDHSPAVCGLIRPTIVLPASLARTLAPDGLRDVLLHELVHVQRRDLWLNLPQVLAQILWWWNPFVWLANARIRLLREQAVDEQVMLLTKADHPATYPTTLVEVARYCAARPLLALSFVGILESRRELRSRVERLLTRPLPRRSGLGLAGWLIVIVTASLALPMAFARRVEPAASRSSAVVTEPHHSADQTKSIVTNVVPYLRHTAIPAVADALSWEPWSEDAVREARNRGQTVLVDFTAKWCLACRVNRATVLDDPTVAAALNAAHVLTLVADATYADKAITATLQSLGRPGVPTVVIYQGDPDALPVVLPEQLTPQSVLIALNLQMDPVLAKRYGLPPQAGTSTNASTETGGSQPAARNFYKMDPILARRYGLVPPPGSTTNQPAVEDSSGPPTAANFYKMDPILARRYGLAPPPGPTTNQPAVEGSSEPPTAANFYKMDPVLARRYGLLPQGDSSAKPPVEAKKAEDNAAHWGTGRQSIMAKLNNLVLPEVAFDSTPLDEVVDQLYEQVRKTDPEKQGINFILNFAEDARRPAPDTGIVPTPLDPSKVIVRLRPGLRNIRVQDALDAILKLADHPLTYSVEDYAVVFTQRRPESQELLTRTFQVNPDTFIRGVEAVTGFPSLPADPASGKRAGTTARARSPQELQALVGTFLVACGVDLPAPVTAPSSAPGSPPPDQAGSSEPSAVTEPKAFFFNDRNGKLFVRATANDLKIVEQAIQALTVAPPSLHLIFRVVEFEPSVHSSLNLDGDRFESDRSLGRSVISGVQNSTQTQRLLEAASDRAQARVVAYGATTAPSGRRIALSFDGNPSIALQEASAGLDPTAIKEPRLTILPTTTPDAHGIDLDVVVRRDPRDPSPVHRRAHVGQDESMVIVLIQDPPPDVVSGTIKTQYIIVTPMIADPAAGK